MQECSVAAAPSGGSGELQQINSSMKMWFLLKKKNKQQKQKLFEILLLL